MAARVRPVIVIIGRIRLRGHGAASTPAGLAAGIGRAATSAGRRVELIAKISDDAIGDELSLALARARIGHVATLRDAAHTTIRLAALDADHAAPELDMPSIDPADIPFDPTDEEPDLDAADVDLALRYLAEYKVVVVVRPVDPAILVTAVAAASWASASLVLALRPGSRPPMDLPADGLVVEAEEDDDDGALARLLGRYAAAVDQGTTPAEALDAFRAAAVDERPAPRP